MQNKIVLCPTVAIALLCGSTAQMQAGTATNILKKTAGVALGVVSLGTAFELGVDLKGDDLENYFKKVEVFLGKSITICLAYLFCFPSALLRDDWGEEKYNELIESRNFSIAVRLALLAATGYGSYKLLKPAAKEEDVEEEYEYSY